MLGKVFTMKFVTICPWVAAFFIAWCGVGEVLGAPDATPGAGATPAPAGPPEMVDGYLKVGFDRLGSFPFLGSNSTAPAAAAEARIPADIKKFDGRKVIVTGFMLPIKMSGDDEYTTEFLLLKSQLLCCYGIAPQANEWVLVERPKGVKPLMDVPISFRGTLHVGAMFENGYLTGIYSLDGE